VRMDEEGANLIGTENAKSGRLLCTCQNLTHRARNFPHSTPWHNSPNRKQNSFCWRRDAITRGGLVSDPRPNHHNSLLMITLLCCLAPRRGSQQQPRWSQIHIQKAALAPLPFIRGQIECIRRPTREKKNPREWKAVTKTTSRVRSIVMPSM